MLRMLREVQKQNPQVHYQFFPSWTSTRYNNGPIIGQELGELFNGNVSIYPNLSYHEYLEKMELAAFSVDSYPFGGYNTIVDSFFVGCPVVTIEGTKFYNRASTALARRVGADLSVGCIYDCSVRMQQLVQNPKYLEVCRQQLPDADQLRKQLIYTDEPQHFTRAIQHILANHPFEGKEPILIQ